MPDQANIWSDRVIDWLQSTGLWILVIVVAALVITKVISLIARRQARRFRRQQQLAARSPHQHRRCAPAGADRRRCAGAELLDRLPGRQSGC
ncbi:MAG: hypothetical protein R2713_15860 [Ilumatobacteraceae bacterium]